MRETGVEKGGQFTIRNGRRRDCDKGGVKGTTMESLKSGRNPLGTLEMEERWKEN